MNRKTDNYVQQPVTDTLKMFDVQADQGLSQATVARRLQEYGYNAFEEKEEPLWHRLFRRFWGPIPWMIEIAALLSALVQKWEDFFIILVMLLVNAGLDFMQEHRALNALKALKAKMDRQVTVLRNGQFERVSSRELVPGDLVKMRIGDILPADVQLLSGDYLLIDQAALTGESLPVSRKVNEVAYANTIVKQGEMLAVVINTGANTRFSSVVSLVAKAQQQERSHFQKMVIQIGNFLILITVALVLLIIMVALFRHENFIEIARFSLVLTVAAIPVALPAVLSVTMAVGALMLARKQAVVSKLTAIEELAGVDILCSDKTGTLTENKMQVADPIVLEGHSPSELFLLAALASQRENNDPIELPIFHYIEEKLPEIELSRYQQTHFTPFDPISKRTEARITNGDEHFTAIKGAAQILINMARLSDEQTIIINQQVEQLAAKGYRTLAVGKKIGEAPLELVGLIPLNDPPRTDSRQVIADMRNYGVHVKMVTGDHLAIAKEIGRLLGLEGETIRSHQLTGSGSQELLALASAMAAAIYEQLNQDITHTEAQRFANKVIETLKQTYDTRLLDREFVHTHESAIIEMIEDVDLFAEVVPEDKYLIVDTLQKGGHIVAMTGDGVNDAPALKKSDCGFAVANATDAARAAADIILTAPGLSVINDAIKQARITFERMKSYSIFRIAETIRIILFMTLAIVVFNFYPITALMIIILALLNDIPILAIATDHTRVDARPVRWNMPEMLTISSVLGVAGVISSFLLFYILLEMKYSEEVIQSMFFAKLVIAGHGTIYNTRIDDWFWKKPYPSWTLFIATFSTRILGTLIAVYGILITPIGWESAMWMWAYALVWFVFNDMIKMWVYRVLRKKSLLT
ncbi:Lead, cadmium, zinc and mercury transporting ATPase; Copper-translocating P-type ATPase [hydrothermal vent metagenome]|uniref:Lead, cadmium, zinc and mercury transporting ATPase Copper-translocating P-type ATPase n=1 Tax=hydrothermal vent metagenome TaxID=652676 RepID=A0A3B1AE56_9ZZZZ